MFLTLKNDYSQLWFYYGRDSWICTKEIMEKIVRNKHFISYKNEEIA